MVIVRLALLLAVAVALGCVVAFMLTGQMVWRQRAVLVVRWVVLLGLALIALAIFGRLVGRLL